MRFRAGGGDLDLLFLRLARRPEPKGTGDLDLEPPRRPDPNGATGDLECLILPRGKGLGGDFDLDLDILGDLDLDLELRDLRPLPPDFLAARFRFITFRTSYLGSSLC